MKLEIKTTDLQFQKDIEIIANLTDNNCHTESLEKIARMFDLRQYYRRFELIEKLHDIEGSMPTDLAQYRSRLSRELMAIVKSIDIDLFTEIQKAL